MLNYREYAIKCHKDTNHTYDDNLPYSYHLQLAANVASEFAYLVDESDWHYVIAAVWCHDVIEDTRQSYNDVMKIIGRPAADIVYAVTNEKGKNRKERANEKYYTGIRNTKHATFVKLCDRIANLRHGVLMGSKMVNMYQKEHADFVKYLQVPERYSSMLETMEQLYTKGKPQ